MTPEERHYARLGAPEPEAPEYSGAVGDTIGCITLAAAVLIVGFLIGAVITDPEWVASWRDLAMLIIGAGFGVACLIGLAAWVAVRLPGWGEWE